MQTLAPTESLTSVPESLNVPGFKYQVGCSLMNHKVPTATMTVLEMTLVLGKALSAESLELVDNMMYTLHLNYTYTPPSITDKGECLYPVSMFPALQCSLRAYGLYHGV